MTGTTLALPSLEVLSEEQLRRLLRASHEFNTTLEARTLFPHVLDQTLEAMDAEAGSLWLVNGDGLRCEVAQGSSADKVRGIEIPLGAGIVGSVVADKRSALVADATQDERFLKQVDDLTGFVTRSIVTVPLIAQGTALGALQILNRRSGVPFDESDVLFLEALADDAAAAIRNARLLDAERQARDLKALLDVSQEIGGSLDQARVAVTVVNTAGKAVPLDRAAVALWYDEKLSVRAISGEAAVDRKSAAVRELERFLTWAAQRPDALYVADLQSGEDAERIRKNFPEYAATAGLRALLCLPIRDGEGEIGRLLFEFDKTAPLTSWTREAAELVAAQAALALRNAELYAHTPFIQWLEPLREKKRALVALPGPVWLTYVAAATALLLVTAVIRLPLRVSAASATVRAVFEQPARAGVAGLVDAVLVKEGDVIAAGAPIARLRNEELEARLNETEAAQAIAEREALSAQARGDAAAAVLARVRAAQLTDAHALLAREAARAHVVAPIAGTVLTPRVEEKRGAWVDAGEPVVWLGNPDWVELELRVRQQDVGVVRVGDRVRARVNALPSVTFEGHVASVAPRAEAGAEPEYVVRALVDNGERMLRPGMAVRARVLTRSRSVAALVLRRPARWLRMHFWW